MTAECWRVLKPSGSLFVNLGDKYSQRVATRMSSHQDGLQPDREGVQKDWKRDRELGLARMPSQNVMPNGKSVREKSLMGLPWRYAIGCIDGDADPDGRGWVLRSEIVWSKPNGLPESVTDRVRRSHEQWFHLTKEGRYYSNVDEVREPHETPLQRAHTQKFNADRNDNDKGDRIFGNPLGKLPGSVWTVPTQPLIVPDWLDVDHFAAFPTEWPRRLILGWSPPGICVECGEGRRAVVEKAPPKHLDWRERQGAERDGTNGVGASSLGVPAKDREATITGTACACDKPTAPTTPAVVLDPFSGTGTVAGVARALGRYGVGCDLSADYMRLARWRIWQSGMGAKVESRTNGERQGVLL